MIEKVMTTSTSSPSAMCRHGSQEVWRIYMLPVGFFFLSVRPVVDMRLWVKEPPHLVALQAVSADCPLGFKG